MPLPALKWKEKTLCYRIRELSKLRWPLVWPSRYGAPRRARALGEGDAPRGRQIFIRRIFKKSVTLLSDIDFRALPAPKWKKKILRYRIQEQNDPWRPLIGLLVTRRLAEPEP